MRRHLAAVIGLAAVVLALAATAGAATGPGAAGPSTTSFFTTGPDGLPVFATLTTAAPQRAGTAAVPAAAGAAAVNPECTIWFQPGWSLTMNSVLWGIAWSETQKGAYYYGCGSVWQSSRYGWDTGGFHRCGYSSGIAFSIDVQSCYKTGDPSSSTMTLGDQFKVSVFVSGFPIYATHEMAVCATPGGGLSTCKWS